MAALPDPDRSQAILIGAGFYRQLEHLPAVRNNLIGFRDVLIDPTLGGWVADRCVVLPEPLSAQDVYRAIRKSAAAATDTLLVYFAGHGMIGTRNELYLCLPDTEPDELWFTALAYEQLREAVADSRATKKVVILDCCFSGRALADQAGNDESIIGQVGIQGTYILTATAANAVALAPADHQYTAFTGNLLHLLRTGIPGGPELLTFAALFPHLKHALDIRGLPNPRQQGNDTIEHLALTRNLAYPLSSTRSSASSILPDTAPPSVPRVTGALSWGPMAIRRFTVRVILPERLAALYDLLLNLRWSWHPPTVELFESIDPAGWAASGGDPVAMLSSMRPGKLAELAGDEDFLRRLDAVVADLRGYTSEPRWYQSGGAGAAEALPKAIAYFSPEYGITAALPQYSGGLGILAGDHLKSASDLGVPVIGVGLLYRHGYFTQSLSTDGWQAERYPADDPNGLPLKLLRDAEGIPVHVSVALAGGKLLTAQVWLAQVGRVPLLLLDSYVEANEPALHEVTDRLYGGGSEHRLRQEMLLGIGGVRAVRAFCEITGHPEPEVFHTNEGHAGFLGLERIREYVAAGLDFDEALEVCRAGTVFTMHTAVPAGIDRFDADLVRRHFANDPLLPTDKVLALGAETWPGGNQDMFNMAVMGMRLAQRVNGVSVLHGQVSREMFADLWPGFDAPEVPIGSITNGVHAPTWVAREVSDLGDSDSAASADAGRLWEIRRQLRARLVTETRRRLRESWRQRGAPWTERTWIDDALDEHVLTIGFARPVSSYKRLILMLNDPARLTQLLNDPDQPVQIIVAGKAHPADEGGKALIQQMVQFSDSADVRRRIVFLPDYDMALAHYLVQGCDVWLNNSLRPLEACGTSGMKAALNGGLNVSVRDGWWDEWYDGANGWEIPTGDGVANPARRDELEASALYELLAKSIAPLFYDLGPDGVPGGWLEMIRHTLRSLGPKVQADRMVGDYVRHLYMPAAVAFRSMADASGYGPARELTAWKRRVAQAWPYIRIEHVESEAVGLSLGSGLTVRVLVELGELTQDDVAVEVLYGQPYENDRIADPYYVTLTAEASSSGATSGLLRFSGEVPLDRPGPFGYTVRVLPRHPLLASRAELGLVAYPDVMAGMTDSDLI